MNENIDLTKILKDCPKGWKLYCSIYGEVEFVCIDEYEEYPIKVMVKRKFIDAFSEKGFIRPQYNIKGILFPSKDQRDWSKFSAPWYNKESIKPKFKVGDRIRHKETNKDDVYEISKVYDDSYGIVGFNWGIYMKYQDQYELVPNKFNPKTLKSFDRVLVRDRDIEHWVCNLFSHIINDEYLCIGSCFIYCIPYNDDTKHLVGTKEEAPEYYRYWED